MNVSKFLKLVRRYAIFFFFSFFFFLLFNDVKQCGFTTRRRNVGLSQQLSPGILKMIFSSFQPHNGNFWSGPRT